MRDAGGGVICNVTSSSLLAPVPFLGAYRSSKAAVSAIGESLQAEVAKFGIRVLEILPGPIETDMLAMSDKPAAAIAHERYRPQAEQLWEGRQRIRDMYTPAPEAARRIANAILDDDAPLRVGCDDMSEGMLAAWRNAASDEAWMRPLLESFLGPV
ncbi:MAG TPA: SDR family NAD(P)-dependent oxidoreductase, partial [Acidimicrobiia bacterium]|nr:SDR family NAD(P)-dependent oxidoreductase [Acidimicrobiia bacterium]